MKVGDLIDIISYDKATEVCEEHGTETYSKDYYGHECIAVLEVKGDGGVEVDIPIKGRSSYFKYEVVPHSPSPMAEIYANLD